MTKQEKDAVSSLALRTLHDKPIERVAIPIKDYTWLDKILRRPTEREFTIYKTRVCNMGRCSEIAYRIPELTGNIETDYDLIKVTYPLIKEYRKDVLYLIAACLQNNSKEPKLSLIKFLADNLNADTMLELLQTCILNSGMASFLSATMLIRGSLAVTAEATDAEAVDLQA